MAVVVGSFVEADTLLDSESIDLLINGIVDVTAVTTVAGTFVYAVGLDDNGLSCFTLSANGTLTNIQNIQNSPTISLFEASLVTSATIGGRTFVYVMGGAGESLSTFEVGTSGQLAFLGSIDDSGLAGPSLDGGNEMNTFTAGGKTYLYVRGGELFTDEDGIPVIKDLINIIELGSNGLPASTFTAPWSDNLADDAVAITIGARTFLVECIPRAPLFGIPSGMGCYEVLADGSLQLTDALVNSSSAPVDLAAAVVGGTNYVVAATIFNTGPTDLTVFKVDGNGALSVVSDYGGTTDDPYLGAVEVVPFTLGGETFVAAIVALTTNVTRVDVLRLDAAGSLTLVSQHAIPSTFYVEASLRIVDGSVVFISAGSDDSALYTFVLGAGADILTGGDGDDTLIGFAGDDVLNGGVGADKIDGGEDNDTASYRGSGSGVAVDLISGRGTGGDADGDTLTAIENLTGSLSADTLAGNAGNNILNDGGVGGADTLTGRGGNDTYSVYNAGAVIVELDGEGNDRVCAGDDYVLATGVSAELLNSTSLHATYDLNLTGNEIKQLVRGNDGTNVLDGAGGNDTLWGMGGTDTFRFSTALSSGNVDKIMDFNVAEDQIALSSAIFSALGVGALDASAFKDNILSARDADDRIIYNSSTGSLFYDADGLGGVAAVKFATLATGLTLTAADFVVV